MPSVVGIAGISGICNCAILSVAVAICVVVEAAVAVPALADILGMKLKFRCDAKPGADLKPIQSH